ncbi:hypothetical protein [Streptomyces sp. DSM 41634]|uniref:hypothetical protein n=1 Tax=Streptomyces sp. DSM 41634 TaxID=3448656 RepID=UPI002885BBBE|nr:hypothetical protein [Streptomyces sp. DSM 41633]
MQLLDWGDSRHYDQSGSRPCALCGKPTPLRSHAGEPVHKVCAEDWNHSQPSEARRYTHPDKQQSQRDIGTWRFHNDGPTAPRKAANVVRLPRPDIQTLELPAA